VESPTLQGVSFKSPLWQMTQTTGRCLWNDSAAEAELEYAIDHGAVGATCNPVIAVEVVRKELAYWTGRIKALAVEHATATEGELAWRARRARGPDDDAALHAPEPGSADAAIRLLDDPRRELGLG
jgi:hypothetical protein